MQDTAQSNYSIKKACFALTLLFGIFYLSIFADYQPLLSTGDHGLNLYAAQAVHDGLRPYHDFHWFYGPFMPYYHALFLIIFGMNIQSVLLGTIALQLVSGILVFATCALFFSPVLSFMAAAGFWLLNFDFFYTFNHTGGITLSLFILYALFAYFKNKRISYLLMGHVGCFLLGMIKLNLGFCGLFCLNMGPVLRHWLTQEKLCKQEVIYLGISSLIIPLALIIANWMCILDLPFYIVSQCYQYFGNDADAHQYQSVFKNLHKLYGYCLGRLRPKIDLIALTLISSLSLLWLIIRHAIRNKNQTDQSKNILLISSLLIFIVAFSHEFLLSGVIFRAFWSQPFVILLLFFTMGLLTNHSPYSFRYVLIFFLLWMMGTRAVKDHRYENKFKNQDHFLALDNANIYVGNGFGWIYTVTRTTRYIKDRIKPDESVLALPYDPLYYFLLDKPSPTRQLAILQFLNITDEQERTIIEEFDQHPIKWIILSNRSKSEEKGQFGISYARLINQYIQNNYVLEKEFGDWNERPEWTKHHGTRILRRVTPYKQ